MQARKDASFTGLDHQVASCQLVSHAVANAKYDYENPQALAAIGQGRLIALWDNLFGMLGQPIAQVLLTRSDISDVRSSWI